MSADPDREAAVCALLQGSPNGEAAAADEAVVACAREHRVHLALAARLRRADLATEIRDAAVVEAAREVELQRTLDALDAADARAICIKGAALAYTHYPRPEMR